MVGQHFMNRLFHEPPIFRVYEVQVFFYGWRLAPWIQARNLEQLGRPVVESSSVECPAARMSETLPFGEIELDSPQSLLGPFPVLDIDG